MKDSVYRTLKSLTTEANEQMLHGMAVGFYAGLAFGKLDPLLASDVDRKLRLEWSLSLDSPPVYGPHEMAKALVAALKEE